MIDVSPFLDMGLVILMATISIVIPLLVKKANDWFGLEVDKKHRESLQGTLVLAINSAMTNIRNRQHLTLQKVPIFRYLFVIRCYTYIVFINISFKHYIIQFFYCDKYINK